LQHQPDHAQANYIVGQHLLANAKAEGIPLIETAISQKPGWLIDGCELIYHFLHAQGQPEAAQPYLKRAEQHQRQLEDAQAERYNITDLKKFKPHTLSPEEVKQLQQQLVAFAEVEAAYLVEKEVTLFPEERFCVLGIVRKQGFLDTDVNAQQLIQLLTEKLESPVQTWVLVLNREGFSYLQKRFKALEGSRIVHG
jgi:hypothetical protein